jgi:hypothetical protein
MRFIAVIKDRSVIARILKHIGEDAEEETAWVATAWAAAVLATARAAWVASARVAWRDDTAGRTGSGRENFSKRDAVEERDERGRACRGAATSWRDAGISSAGDAGGGGVGAEDGSSAMLERRTALEFLSSSARGGGARRQLRRRARARGAAVRGLPGGGLRPLRGPRRRHPRARPGAPLRRRAHRGPAPRGGGCGSAGLSTRRGPGRGDLRLEQPVVRARTIDAGRCAAGGSRALPGGAGAAERLGPAARGRAGAAAVAASRDGVAGPPGPAGDDLSPMGGLRRRALRRGARRHRGRRGLRGARRRRIPGPVGAGARQRARIGLPSRP